MLLTEKNTQSVERLVMRDAKQSIRGRNIRLAAFFDHGQWWVEDRYSGAQWSACDYDGPNGEKFCFEQVSIGTDF